MSWHHHFGPISQRRRVDNRCKRHPPSLSVVSGDVRACQSPVRCGPKVEEERPDTHRCSERPVENRYWSTAANANPSGLDSTSTCIPDAMEEYVSSLLVSVDMKKENHEIFFLFFDAVSFTVLLCPHS